MMMIMMLMRMLTKMTTLMTIDSDAMHEDVVLSVFRNEEVEDLVRPTITRSGRSITRRYEIDFSYF